MIVVGRRAAIHIATLLFPAAVGPQTTSTSITSAPTEPPLNLVPAELHDRGPAVHVVRGEGRIAQRNVERAHFARRQCISSFDRGLARDCRGKLLVSRVRTWIAISGQRGERLTQTLLRVEPRVRQRDGADDQRVSTEPIDLESE